MTDVQAVTPIPDQSDDEIAYDFAAWGRESMAECEGEWQAKGFSVAWIDTHPKWIPVTCWGPPLDILPRPHQPIKRMWRFSLIGGGQLRIAEHWTNRRVVFPAGFEGLKEDWVLYDGTQIWHEKTTLKVTAHADGGLLIKRGELGGAVGEMSAHAVLLERRDVETQSIAERAAATLRALTDDETGDCTHPERDRFYALLDGTDGCSVCARPLRDEISKLLAIGPDCARAWGRPHTRAEASRRLELRRRILNEA
jgi:hypothetical protein